MTVRVAEAFAPGRITLIGEHTDYNDGLALAFATTAGVSVRARRLSGARVEARAHDLGEEYSFDAHETGGATGWRAYLHGAYAELRTLGYEPPPASIEISSELPIGSGMASSAALTLALCMALVELSGDPALPSLALARLAQTVEQVWAGAQTGLLDQLASLHGADGQAVLIDFRELTLERMPLRLDGSTLVTLASGEVHTNSASGYNSRRAECTEAAHRMGVESLRDALIQDLHMLPDTLAARARHVISENGRVLAAARALRDGDLTLLGRLLDLTHASLRDDYEVSTPAVERTVDALKAAGAIGARLIGGGFGGSVIALMPQGTVAPAGATVISAGTGAHLLG